MGDHSQDPNTKAAAIAFRYNVLSTIDHILESMFAQSCVKNLKLQILSGDDLNAGNKEQETALHIAAKSGLMTAVENLIELKADCNIKNSRGLTASAVAKEYGYTEIERKLKDQET